MFRSRSRDDSRVPLYQSSESELVVVELRRRLRSLLPSWRGSGGKEMSSLRWLVRYRSSSGAVARRGVREGEREERVEMVETDVEE